MKRVIRQLRAVTRGTHLIALLLLAPGSPGSGEPLLPAWLETGVELGVHFVLFLVLAWLSVGAWPAGRIGGASPLVAALEGVPFAERYREGETLLTIKGVGLARYLMFFKVYVAALYLDEDLTPCRALSDVPKRLEVSYLRPIEGPDFATAAERVLPQNVPASTIASLRPRIDQLNALYEGVKPGDRYSLTYIPGKGTELALNGMSKGIIEGADFAEAYFAIWLGPSPISEGLKSGLVGDC